jgi:hypothetical protein
MNATHITYGRAKLTPRLSSFDQTILEIAAQAKDDNEAMTYIQDWLNDKDTRCTRSDAQRYLDKARAADAKINLGQG